LACTVPGPASVIIGRLRAIRGFSCDEVAGALGIIMKCVDNALRGYD
jgi:hypothetical protein